MDIQTQPRRVKAVVAKVAIRDESGVSHPRGLVVEVSEGRIAFYRDVTAAVLFREYGGWAIEAGVLSYLKSQGIEKVHYREIEGPLYSATVDQIIEQGTEIDRNNRHQYVLSTSKWTRYSADLAYVVPKSDLDWTVVDHRTGKVEGEDEPIEEAETEATEMDRVSFTAHHAMDRLAVMLENGTLKGTGAEEVVKVLSWLVMCEEERRAQERDR